MDMNMQNKHVKTVLQQNVSIPFEFIETIETLLQVSHIDIDITDKDGNSALYYAIMEGHTDIVFLLV